MKININILNNAYKTLKRALAVKTNILLEQDKLIAYKGDIIIHVPLEMEETFDKPVYIDKGFFEKLKNIKEEFIDVDFDKGVAKVNNVMFATNHSISEDIVPVCLTNNLIEEIQLSYEDIKKFYELYDFIAKDDIRPVLQCINWNRDTICSLDGYRLSKKTITSELVNEFNINGEVAKILSKLVKKDYTCRFIFTEDIVNVIVMNKGKVIADIFSKLGENNFIEYNTLINLYDEIARYITLDPTILVENLKFVKDNMAKTVGLHFNKDGYKISNFKSKTEITVSDSLYKTKDLEDEGFEIYCNYQYLYDSLKTKKNIVDIQLRSKVSPINILTNDDKDVDLILPVRVSE